MKTIYVAVSENDRRLIIDGSFDLLDAFLQVIQGDRTDDINRLCQWPRSLSSTNARRRCNMKPNEVSPEERARRLGNVAAILIELALRKQAAEANENDTRPADVDEIEPDVRDK